MIHSGAIHSGVIPAVFACATAGWATAGPIGVPIGLLIGLALVVPWWGQPPWKWAGLFVRRNSGREFVAPVTVTNDGSAGGVRYQDGVAATAIRVLGKAHQPTILAGSVADTADVLDVVALLPVMRQTLGLTVESLSVVTMGARRRTTGDYPPVYDNLLGTVPYAGRRETWLIVRIPSMENAEALRCRASVGVAALAATQRIAAQLRRNGIRATVAGAADITELDDRLGRSATAPENRRWHCLRSRVGWLTTYGYTSDDLKRDALEQVWTLPVDGVTRNVTVFPDGTATATVTLRTAQPPNSSPGVRLRTLSGRQVAALTASLCGPRSDISGVTPAPLPATLVLPIGPSGVLLGRLPFGERLMLPMGDPGTPTRIHIAAGDAVTKRIVVRMAAAGEQVSLHTNDFRRWQSICMPGVTVTDQLRSDAGATVCVVDGTVSVTTRTATVVAVGPPGRRVAGADVAIAETGPGAVLVDIAGQQQRRVEVEFVRAEDRYIAPVVAPVVGPVVGPVVAPVVGRVVSPVVGPVVTPDPMLR